MASGVLDRIFSCAEMPGPRVFSDGCPQPLTGAEGYRVDTDVVHGGSPLRGDALDLLTRTDVIVARSFAVYWASLRPIQAQGHVFGRSRTQSARLSLKATF